MKLGLVILLCIGTALGYDRTKPILTIDVNDQNLLSKDILEKVTKALISDGAIGVNGLGQQYESAIHGLREKAPECFKTNGIPSFKMADSSMRTTFAAQPSDKTSHYLDCIEDDVNTISAGMDQVFNTFTTMLEKIVGKHALQWKPSSDQDDILEFSQLLKKEHIHVYHPNKAMSKMPEVPLEPHQDNGILLLLTHHKNHPVQITDKIGVPLDLSLLDDSSVIIMVARALPNWLLPETSLGSMFQPAVHSVSSLTGPDRRTVMARMMVAPLDAVRASQSSGQKRFKDIFLYENTHDDRLCTTWITPKSGSWDEFQQRMDCEDGYSYCWMSCLVLPYCAEGAQPICLNETDELCCTSPDQEGTGTCLDMDETCQFLCP